MRIAFSGSGGTGKTTTLKAVNEKLGYPVVQEGVRKYMTDHNIEHLPIVEEKKLVGLITHGRLFKRILEKME